MKKIATTSKRYGFSLGAILALTIGTPAFADCPDLSGATAAQLIHSEIQDKLIADLVSKWKSKEPVRIIKFGAYVSRTGRLEDACCISSAHRMSQGASQRLGRKIALLKFSPANRMGDNVRVFVDVTIIARKTADGVQTTLVLNHLHSMDTFGVDYSAPQRIWSASISSGSRLASAVTFEIQTMVDQSGHASGARVSNKGSNSSAMDGLVMGRIESACFIPGFHKGEATAMLYAEGFENQ